MNSQAKPPLGPHSSLSNSRKQSSSGSRKSPRNSPSDSPSSSATNQHGRDVLHDRLRSVLCHRLGLPLLYAFHGEDPATLEYLHKERAKICSEEEEGLNRVFAASVNEWKAGDINEPQLTKILVKKTNERKPPFHAHRESQVKENEKQHGKIDIVFSKAKLKKDPSESTPLTVIEFGLDGNDWWKKFDQGVRYVDMMRSQTQDQTFLQFKAQPLLLAIVTYNDESCGKNKCEFRIGVFLCSRKNTDDVQDEYRMSLLWRMESNTLKDASNLFGRLLRVTADFQLWRESSDVQLDDGYEYFSSNCCKVGIDNDEVVLRSYDNRFRTTNRSPQVYQSPDCGEIVGDVTTIVDLQEEGDIVATESEKCHISAKFWIKSKERTLLIIAVPYRRGRHVAKKPLAFVPIIDQLIALHNKGFVHGDIRAFNTVFGEEENDGWLIDFDFGGSHESTYYPKRYRKYLEDGFRVGGGDGDDKAANKIYKWHDWYALVQLIVTVHELEPPQGQVQVEQELQLVRLTRFWKGIDEDPAPEKISELKGFLTDLDDRGWTVKPSSPFAKALAFANTTAPPATKRGATGSPPDKKHH